jgi:hypothetical protein
MEVRPTQSLWNSVIRQQEALTELMFRKYFEIAKQVIFECRETQTGVGYLIYKQRNDQIIFCQCKLKLSKCGRQAT